MATGASDVMILKYGKATKVADMTLATMEIQAFEGRQVCVALADGCRFEGCSLVSAGRGAAKTVWLVIDHMDAFLQKSDVVAIWGAP